MKLHWLPVKQRVQYSILLLSLLVFRAQHRLAPPYNDFYVPPSRC
ncbi:hypothetical protein NP493_111g03010 [Ridgeia piscesae]|uniref:Uncharacterized protein n=1 Tax=Ridgeia piscesae TaxID=27915 RepID=A0AAD9P6Y2_RIDPI|nr:hypothetical protein NP493_111g03010 [Ridgeia piscesae]